VTDAATVHAIERPHARLLQYYALRALAFGPFFPIALVPLYFRYHTMRYRFDDEGISMRWGILFRREIHLTYARIQDIHLRSNVVERWFGLARIQIQTASGSASAEMTIEGLLEYEALRDFIYGKMRGQRPGAAPSAAARPPAAETDGAPGELARVLGEVAAELRALRLELERRGAEDV
jgi:putative membrane protein